MAKGDDGPQASSDFYKPRPVGFDVDVVRDWPPSLARQEFADECDINTLMQRYERTGQLPMNGSVPMYMDLTSMPETLMETLAMLKDAESAFMRLPAKVRREFDNDPVAFTDFAMNADNLEQMRAWGLAEPAPEPAILPEPKVAPEPPKAPQAPAKAP